MTPEDQELHKKRIELSDIEGELADREVEHATIKMELRAFEAEYFRRVGRLYAELDELEAQIVEAEARRQSGDESFAHKATEARARAVASAQAVAAIAKTDDRFRPNDALKKLYREIARRMHPDLAVSETDRALRTRLMAKANQAYADGDELVLRSVLDEWNSNPEAIEGNTIGAELVRTIRKIHQAQRRVADLNDALAGWRQSSLYRLREQVVMKSSESRDLLAEMTNELSQQIAAARQRLAHIAVREATA